MLSWFLVRAYEKNNTNNENKNIMKKINTILKNYD